jgi:hypothetical protein
VQRNPYYWNAPSKRTVPWEPSPGAGIQTVFSAASVFLLFLFWVFVDVVTSFIEVLNAAFPSTPL